jgi:hypothetical protein
VVAGANSETIDVGIRTGTRITRTLRNGCVEAERSASFGLGYSRLRVGENLFGSVQKEFEFSCWISERGDVAGCLSLKGGS